jgi:hypothetical protein
MHLFIRPQILFSQLPESASASGDILDVFLAAAMHTQVFFCFPRPLP